MATDANLGIVPGEVAMEQVRKQRERARKQDRRERDLLPVLERIREDAERDPRRYAEESEVPAGGE
jgi:hypothetical protein